MRRDLTCNKAAPEPQIISLHHTAFNEIHKHKDTQEKKWEEKPGIDGSKCNARGGEERRGGLLPRWIYRRESRELNARGFSPLQPTASE